MRARSRWSPARLRASAPRSPRRFAAEGAAVVVNYAGGKAGADKVVAEIEAAGGKAKAVQASVTKATDVERLLEETKAAFGPVDVLVNNAGVYQMAPLAEVTEAEFHRQFDTNVLGLLLVTQAAARQFGPNGGSVINISSIVSTITPPASSVYSGTKGAVDAITLVLSKELGPRKIRVNAINPGLIETEGTHTAGFMGSDFEKGAVAGTPLGRLGQPGDIATIAVFLASDDSGWLSGERIIAAGGSR